MALSEEQVEKARVTAMQKHAETQRAKEEATRKARVEQGKRDVSLIAHGPART